MTHERISYFGDSIFSGQFQAELRFERHVPPGWEDEGKKDYIKRYGDIILWFQLIDYARTQKKPIIFITDDVKQDWWLAGEEAQGPIRPRPELVQEMYREAGVLFHMYQGYEFMTQAQHFLQLEEKPGVIEEIKEVGQQEFLDRNYSPRQSFADFRNEAFQAEQAVLGWLRDIFPPNIEIIANRLRAPDFVITWSDGTRIGVDVKLFRGSFLARPYTRLVIEAFGLLNLRHVREQIDKLVLVFVCKTKIEAENLAEAIQKRLEIPTDIVVVVVHLETDGQLYVVSTLPQFDQQAEWIVALSSSYRQVDKLQQDDEFSFKLIP